MATNKLAVDAQKLESCVAPSGDGDTPNQVKILQVPAKCGPITGMHPPATAPCVSKVEPASAPPKVIPTGQTQKHISTRVTVPELHTSSPSVMVIAKVATARAANSQPQVIKPAVSQGGLMNQATNPGRTVVITVPRAATTQPLSVSPRMQQTTSPQLPANIQIPPGMMLIRSDSGQLMLVSQQALVQAQQGARGVSGQVSRLVTPQEPASAGHKTNEKVTVIRMAAPTTFQQAQVQKTAVVKVIGVTSKPAVVQSVSAVSEQGSRPRFHGVVTETRKEPPVTYSQETLESVKKCKNFLVTLIKLASSDSRSANMANNVRGLVKKLLEGKLEAEEFTEQLYQELKTTPQPCLVPFLKKSLPAVRRLTADPQLFIQQASASIRNPNTPSSTMKQSGSEAEKSLGKSQQVIQQLQGVTIRPGFDTLTQSRYYLTKNTRPTPKHTVVQPEKHYKETFLIKQPFPQDLSHRTKFAFKESVGSYKEDDDINDVASMAGVNLREENAKILTTMVGSVVKSCQDQPFLSPNPVLSRILHTGQALGVTDVGPDVVGLVSHATQECLRGLLEKLTLMANHRKATLKEDSWHSQVSDVRSQLRFMEEVENLKKKKKDEEERERLLRLARNRSQSEDPQQQLLKQRAKELQKMEEAQLQQREANLTALAAIGPRRKRPLEQTESQMTLLHRQSVQRVTRVMLRDLLVCMEQDQFLRHSLTLYKAML
ncbi:transcription initiation factor TFIID subunit 4B-like [Notolabrus celidotus]|uniref:transcription initiation factor TFIID subunit 4B-like n=1 Tax=Notolabrus celidotus TaxID=1203425 RepID=UPI00148F4B04|nr:transcription initiation factor TFIID subunit 4B-like [Notolabrus celidotus]XP_034529990.1 transcription initiation factor TFIID subunit 4B-like [Notolabrus celidotus]